MNQDINSKAYAQARLIVRRKIMEQAGTLYESLTPSGQSKVDQLVEKKQQLVKAVAHKLITKFKQHDKSFSHGTPIRNLGRPEGMNENINNMFLEYFPQYDVSNALGQKVDIPLSQQTNPVYRDGKPDDKNKSPIVQYAKFGNEKISGTPVAKSISKKAQKAGIKEEVLGEVYDRGLDAWTEDTGVSRQQYAFARVNSFINKGKTYYNEDADLHEMGGDQHYGDAKGAFSKGAKGTPITPEKMKKDTSKTLNQMFQKSMKKEEVQIDEISSKTLFSYGKKARKEAEANNDPMHRYSGRLMASKKTNPARGGYKLTKVAATFGEEAKELDELSKDTMKRYKDDATWDRDYESGTESDKNWNKRDKGIQLAKKKLGEGREPGKAYVKPFHNERGEHVGYVSSTKWGNKKWWRKSEGGIAKAKAHAGVDTISEESERKDVHAVARQDDGDRKTIKNVERNPDAKDPKDPKSSLTRNTEIQRKIIEAKVGNVQNKPSKRLIGTDSLVKAYTADTPCAKVNETLDESFNIAFAAGVGVTLTAADLGMRAQGGFAYHPSVIAEMEEVEEDVTSALKQPVYMPPIRNADGSYQPAKTVMRKTQKKIVKSGNVHDGSVDDLTTGMGPV